MHREADPESHL